MSCEGAVFGYYAVKIFLVELVLCECEGDGLRRFSLPPYSFFLCWFASMTLKHFEGVNPMPHTTSQTKHPNSSTLVCSDFRPGTKLPLSLSSFLFCFLLSPYNTNRLLSIFFYCHQRKQNRHNF